MKRFDEKETYIDKLGLILTTYERNNKESVNLRIGCIIKKTYCVIGDKKIYVGCKHMSETQAINFINYSLETGEKMVNN